MQAVLFVAAANVEVASLAEKSGNPIGCGLFLRYGVITTFMSMALASVSCGRATCENWVGAEWKHFGHTSLVGLR